VSQTNGQGNGQTAAPARPQHQMRTLDLKLRIWRQAGPAAAGQMVEYDVPDVSEDMSFLEMLDLLNERLIAKGEEPIAFEHDCREGICGSCGISS
jgi:succinate dehydrogenase / fumarate reductase iron-sulfur subunit